MRDPITIQLDQNSIEVGQTLRGQILVAPELANCSRVSLSLTTTLAHPNPAISHTPLVMSSGILEDQDVRPGSLLNFELDIPLQAPLSFGRQRLVLQADWLEDAREPVLHKITIKPDYLWKSLLDSLEVLELGHTSSSGLLFQPSSGPVAGRLLQLFQLRPLGGPFASSLDSLEVVFDRGTPLGDVIYAAANKPASWFAGPGPHLNHYAQVTFLPPENISFVSLNTLISEALLA